MKYTVDTNVLVRAVLDDHPEQARLARVALKNAELIAVTPTALCEFVWVLSRGYGVPHDEIGAAIRSLIAAAKVTVNRPIVEQGLAFLEAGGDFADGVIAFEGAELGGKTFLSFDRDAVARLKSPGQEGHLPGY